MAMHFEKRYGRPLSAQAISEGAEAGEEVCRRHMESYAHWLAKGLASVMNVVDPDVIVLGGGLSNVDFCIVVFRSFGRNGCSATGWTPGWCRRNGGIPVGFVGPLGFESILN